MTALRLLAGVIGAWAVFCGAVCFLLTGEARPMGPAAAKQLESAARAIWHKLTLR